MQRQSTRQEHAADRQELDRNAYNIAFRELDLCWQWDEQTYLQLQAICAETDRLRAYLQAQHEYLLKAYDADFLVDAIRITKERCYDDLLNSRRER